MRRFALLAFAAAGALAGCHTDMWVQEKTPTQEANPMFDGGQSARPPVEGTVAWTPAPVDDAFVSGAAGGRPVLKVPIEATERALKAKTLRDVLARGQNRFDVFCSPCHGRLGDGQGMIASRGIALVRQPRNFHEARIVDAPDGHLFQVITNGYGAMYSYGDRIPPPDRWAIVAYVRALEYSENAGGGAGG